jgi:hypothetical protein
MTFHINKGYGKAFCGRKGLTVCCAECNPGVKVCKTCIRLYAVATARKA